MADDDADTVFHDDSELKSELDASPASSSASRQQTQTAAAALQLSRLPAPARTTEHPLAPGEPESVSADFVDAGDANQSRQAEVAAIPTGPASLIQTAIGAASSSQYDLHHLRGDRHHDDDLQDGEVDSRKDHSARTAVLKALVTDANVQKTAKDGDDVSVSALKGDRGAAAASQYALDKIPSLDDYIAYLRELQRCWPDAPKLDICFQHLNYEVKVPADEVRVPSISKSFLDFFRWISFQQQKPVPLQVFQDCTGLIPHGRMTLVLAPPGAGKSQLLKTLAGRMRSEKRVTGDLWYNGLSADEQLQVGQYVEKLCALVAQGDVHMANLTVRETLKFSLDSCVADPSLLGDAASERLLAWHARKVDLLLSVLGMHECADTIAGNAVIRGISGGQKKRLTIGEFMVTNARVLLLDEPTTGLDAAVARDIMLVLRQWCVISGSTVIAALLQPTPECYALYDEVVLMREGHIIYHGPRTDIPHFLWHFHGLQVDPEQDIADFLVDWMTDPRLVYSRQRKRWSRKGGPTTAPQRLTREEDEAETRRLSKQQRDSEIADDRKEFADTDRPQKRSALILAPAEEEKENADDEQQLQRQEAAAADQPRIALALPSTAAVRLTNEELVAAYHASPYYAEQLLAVAQVQKQRGSGHVEQLKAATSSLSPYTREQYGRLYARSFVDHTKASLSRQFTLISRDKQTIPPRLFSSVLIAVILGTLFFRLGIDDFYGKFGMLLFALLNSAMGNFTELPAAFEGRNAVYKHLDAGMYPPLSYLVSVVMGFFPIMILETIFFSIPLYFLVGLADEAGRFFFFFLVLLITDLMLAGLYRGVCYTVATIDQGQQVLSPIFNMMIVFGGFLITRDKIPDFLIEFYWLTPISWAMRSLVQNEFQASEYSGQTSYNGGNVTLGDSYLLAFEVQTDPAYKWAGIGYEIGFAFFSIMAASYLLVHVRFDLLQGTKRKKEDLNFAGNTPPPSSPAAGGALASPASPSVVKTASLQTIDIPPPGLSRGTSGGQHSSRVINATFSIPFQPMSLVFKDLHYTVKVKNSEGKTVDRQLLNGISGYVKPGQLTALMGASGAGKTTLMDVIAGRKTAGKIEGSIIVNGQPQDPAVYRRISAYVEQADAHMPLSTVRESMLFSAQLRLPNTVPVETRERFVDELIELLELTAVKDRIVGNENYVGLSPGQLKLLTIGVELVSNPSVLFLDEPTSGLDSRAALVVMRVVKNIAATGRTVLCTIHQPSAEVFYLFDYLLLLKSGGETVYFGPVGDDGEAIVEYFEYDGKTGDETRGLRKRVGGPRRPAGMNPASWMLDVIGAGVAGALSRAVEKEAVRQQQNDAPAPESLKSLVTDSGAVLVQVGSVDYAALYMRTQLWQREQATSEALSQGDADNRVEVDLSLYHIAWYRLLWIVLRRGFVSSWRDSKTNYGRIMTLIFLGIMFGLIYLQIEDHDYAGVNSKLAAIFSVIGFGGMLQNQLALPNVIAERAVFYRERASDSYSSWMYSLTLGVVEVPYIAFSILLFILPYYFMVGFNNDAADFFKFYLSVFMLSLVLSSLGQWAGATFPSFVAAIQMSGMLVTFWFLFGGVFIHPVGIPSGWYWSVLLSQVLRLRCCCLCSSVSLCCVCQVLRAEPDPQGSDRVRSASVRVPSARPLQPGQRLPDDPDPAGRRHLADHDDARLHAAAARCRLRLLRLPDWLPRRLLRLLPNPVRGLAQVDLTPQAMSRDGKERERESGMSRLLFMQSVMEISCTAI